MENLNKYIEHTLLAQNAKKDEIVKLCNEAKEHNFRGVCVNPCNVEIAHSILKDTDVKIVTVIGFPLGANCSQVKVFETTQALLNGADEIDLVINIGAAKDGRFTEVETDIQDLETNIWKGILYDAKI